MVHRRSTLLDSRLRPHTSLIGLLAFDLEEYLLTDPFPEAPATLLPCRNRCHVHLRNVQPR